MTLPVRFKAWRSARYWGTLPHDRYVLEEIILPALASRPDMQHVLFVGCAVHTAHYESLFPGRDFVTIDVDPTKARYGARRHVVDTIANLESHFEADTLDVVVCNGVIGWGLDRADEIDCAASQCFECLRPGGVFIIGWNDIPERRPIAFNDLEGFRRFARLTLPPFPGPVYPTLGPSRHVYNFYMKPRGAR